MRSFFTLLIVVAFTLPAFSKSDTTFLYFNENWKDCHKDTAFYYGIIYPQDGFWHRKDFWVKGNQIQMHAIYQDKERKTAQGLSTWYYINGQVESTVFYDTGKIKAREVFYDDGKRKAVMNFIDNKIEKQTGWDKNGNEIPNYEFEKEAVFPGGLEAWKAYLERNLDANVANRSVKRPGIYTVKVQFIVDKEGNISNVQAVEFPKDCYKCGTEAVRVIKNGPKWVPAVQNGQKVIYQAIQYVSFQVTR